MAGNEVRVRFGAVDNLTPSIKKIAAQLTGLVGGAVAVTTAVRQMQDSIKLAGEREQALRKIEQTIRSTGAAAGVTASELQVMAAGFQDVTKYSQDAVSGMQGVLLTFTQIGGDLFPRVTESILDMSTAFDVDLKTATVQLGKALNDPITGLTALRRIGVSFSEDQTKVITALAKTGEVAKAQALILDELELEFGGVSRAAADTFSGSMTQAKNAIDDAKISLGNALLPTLAKIADKFKDAAGWVEEFFNKLRQDAVDKAIENLERMGVAVETLDRLRGVRDLQDALESVRDNAETAASAVGLLQGFAAGPQQELGDNYNRFAKVVQEQMERVRKHWEEVQATLNSVGVDTEMVRGEMEALAQSAADDPFSEENMERAKELLATVSDGMAILGESMVGNKKLQGEMGEEAVETLGQWFEQLSLLIGAQEQQLRLQELLERARTQSETGVVDHSGAGFDLPDVGDPAKQEKAIAELQTMLDGFRLSEVEKAQQWYDDQLTLLGEHEEGKALLYEVYQERLNALNEDASTKEGQRLTKLAVYEKRIKDRALADKKARDRQEFEAQRKLFGDIGNLARAFGREGFAIAQVAAVGQATMDTYAAANKALASVPPPFSFAAAAAAVAAGMANVYQIMAQQPPAAHGGLEYVPEEQTYLLQRGERVLSPNQNRELMDALSNIESAVWGPGQPGNTYPGWGPGTETAWMDGTPPQALAWDIRKGRQELSDVAFSMMGGGGSDWEKHKRYQALMDEVRAQNYAEMDNQGKGEQRMRLARMRGQSFASTQAWNYMDMDAARQYWSELTPRGQEPHQSESDEVNPYTGSSALAGGGGAPVTISQINIAPTNPESLKDITPSDWEEILVNGLAPAIEAVARNGGLSIPSNASMEV